MTDEPDRADTGGHESNGHPVGALIGLLALYVGTKTLLAGRVESEIGQIAIAAATALVVVLLAFGIAGVVRDRAGNGPPRARPMLAVLAYRIRRPAWYIGAAAGIVTLLVLGRTPMVRASDDEVFTAAVFGGVAVIVAVLVERGMRQSDAS